MEKSEHCPSCQYDKVILGRGKTVSEVKGQVKVKVKVQLKMIKILHFFSHFFESHGHSGKKNLLHYTKLIYESLHSILRIL